MADGYFSGGFGMAPELVLEPNENPAAKTYQEAIFRQGIPAAAFMVDDIQKEYERLKKLA